MTHQFYKTCDRLRQETGGESLWQAMMANATTISEAVFLAACSVSELLDDPTETFAEWKETSNDCAFYRSECEDETLYFIQTGGFEFIFRPMSLPVEETVSPPGEESP